MGNNHWWIFLKGKLFDEFVQLNFFIGDGDNFFCNSVSDVCAIQIFENAISANATGVRESFFRPPVLFHIFF